MIKKIFKFGLFPCYSNISLIIFHQTNGVLLFKHILGWTVVKRIFGVIFAVSTFMKVPFNLFSYVPTPPTHTPTHTLEPSAYGRWHFVSKLSYWIKRCLCMNQHWNRPSYKSFQKLNGQKVFQASWQRKETGLDALQGFLGLPLLRHTHSCHKHHKLLF